MEKIAVYGLVAVVVVVGLAVVLFAGQGGAKTVPPAASSGQTAPATGGTLLSSEPYYSYTYAIAPGNLSPEARAALDGYNMTVSNGGSGENVTLSISGRSATVSLQGGKTLYIVETSFGDDAPGYEGSLGDDGFVLVDQNGYVVNTFVV